jgi:hypothetical protein
MGFDDGREAAIADERERCVLLCKEMAGIHEASARRMRGLGSIGFWFWPFGARRVRPAWERSAQHQDGAARSLMVVANCIRIGYDTRKKFDPNEQIILPVPATDAELAQAVHGLI